MDKNEMVATVRRWAPRALAAMFAGSGAIHFIKPDVFTPIVPRWLPSPLGIVYVSGAAELVCAVGLTSDKRWASPASAALLVAVLPAHFQMAFDATAEVDDSAPRSARWKVFAAWVRIPMQLPLIWAALQAGRR